MLIEFTVGNYRSFKEPQTLSLVAAPLKSKDKLIDANNIIRTKGQPDLLTSAAIYGANASGKSNLIKALGFMRSFVRDSLKETRREGGIDTESFRLNPASAAQPSYFEVVFIQEGVRYRYGFEADQERVIREWLFSAVSNRESMLFEREGDRIAVGRKFTEGRKLTGRTRPNSLFLSVVAQFDGSTAQTVIKWFHDIIITSAATVGSSYRFYRIDRFQDATKLEKIRRLVGRLDLGISDLKVVSTPLMEPELSDDMSEELRELARATKALLALVDPSDRETVAVRTVHTIYDDEGHLVGRDEFDLDDHESAGTKKLFALAIPILEALEEGTPLVIDELDARLHPMMTRELVSLFNSQETNPHGAQLIFATQDTNLLDSALFRRDQIWFVEKNRQGASNLYSLAEFKGVRNDLSLERNYIQGRFGAVPYINLNKFLALVAEGDGEER